MIPPAGTGNRSGGGFRWDHSDDTRVYSRYKVREKLEYMHANPVKRGLVKNASAWMWSSFSFYETGQPGLVEIDPVG